MKSPRKRQQFGRVTEEAKETARQFYCRDTISRQYPNRKDVINIKKSDGTREAVAKRLLMYNLREVHHLFKAEYPNTQIGLSLFCTLRPIHCVIVSSKSQEVCCCPICANLKFLFYSVKWMPSEVDNRPPSSIREMLVTFVCDPENTACMRGECTECPIRTTDDFAILDLIDEDNEAVEIQIKQWENKGNLSSRLVSLDEFGSLFKQQMQVYLRHTSNINIQAKALRKHKDTLTPNTIILQVDFAENYTIKQQEETMAGHFKRTAEQSATIYTAIVHYKDADTNEIKEKSFGVISNTTNHRSLEVQVFNSYIFSHLRTECNININHVHLWTDGAAAHFKNRYSMVALSHHRQLHGCLADWSFMESYHGKGPHDGIGAVIKHNVYRRALQNRPGEPVVTRAKDVFRVATELMDKTVCLYVSKEDIEGQREKYGNLWNNCSGAKNILKARFIRPVAPYRIHLYASTLDDNPTNICNLEEKDPATEGQDIDTHTHSEESEEETDDALVLETSEPAIDVATEEQSARAVKRPVQRNLNFSDSGAGPSKSKENAEEIISVNSFLISKYQRSHYVAQILKAEHHKGYAAEYVISYLRLSNKDNKHCFFHFPEKTDTDTVTSEKIVAVLPHPMKAGNHFKWEWNEGYPKNIL